MAKLKGSVVYITAILVPCKLRFLLFSKQAKDAMLIIQKQLMLIKTYPEFIQLKSAIKVVADWPIVTGYTPFNPVNNLITKAGGAIIHLELKHNHGQSYKNQRASLPAFQQPNGKLVCAGK
jgi:hypothetical protein